MTRRKQKERNISDVEMGLSGRNFPCEEDALAADCYQIFICLLRPTHSCPQRRGCCWAVHFHALVPALWFSMYPSCSTLGLSGFYALSLPLLSNET